MQSNRFLGGLVTLAWVALVGSALMVVNTKYQLRGHVAELQSIAAEKVEAQVALGQLLLEQATVADYDRIENYSRDQLLMKAPLISDTIELQDLSRTMGVADSSGAELFDLDRVGG